MKSRSLHATHEIDNNTTQQAAEDNYRAKRQNTSAKSDTHTDTQTQTPTNKQNNRYLRVGMQV